MDDVKLPVKVLKEAVSEHFYKEWTKEFHDYNGARMGKLFYHGPDKIKAKYVLKLSRLRLARFIRIISGHNSLFYFRNKIDKEISPICRFCNEEDETFIHLLNECPRFTVKRREILYNREVSNNHKWSIQELIEFSFLPGVDNALQGDTSLRWYGEHSKNSSQSSLEEANGID